MNEVEQVVVPQPARLGKNSGELPSWRWEELRTTLWVIPSLLILLAVVLFAVTFSIDLAAFHHHLTLPFWIRTGSAAVVPQVLIAIAAAVITVIGVVFSNPHGQPRVRQASSVRRRQPGGPHPAHGLHRLGHDRHHRRVAAHRVAPAGGHGVATLGSHSDRTQRPGRHPFSLRATAGRVGVRGESHRPQPPALSVEGVVVEAGELVAVVDVDSPLSMSSRAWSS